MFSHPPARFTLRAAPGRHLLVALLLALFVALLYYPLLFTNRVLASGDILLYFYPYRDYAAAALRAGHLPLWNPYIFNGVPFLANPQAAVLYPLHWPLSWLPVTKQIYWSAAIHTWLLGYGGYALVRRYGQGAWPGLVTALVLAGSGFYGGLIGHINQMNGAAWLPWALWVLLGVQALPTGNGIHSVAEMGNPLKRVSIVARYGGAVAHCALLVTLMLLAGHTQTLYINLFGVGLWLLWDGLMRLPDWRLSLTNLHRLITTLGPPLLVYGLGVLLAIGLCAAQLLPTIELSNLGLRSGGLTYNEVSSFSLRPLRLPWSLLPTYGLLELGPIFGAGYTEFVGYIGLIGLALALPGAWKGRGALRNSGLFFALLGLILALGRWNPAYYLLYKLVPGFDLFRVPARWLMLYTLGMALLSGAGMAYLAARLSSLNTHRSLIRLVRPALAALTLLLTVDLLLAARALPHSQPTAPDAVYGVRTAPAHLLTDPTRAQIDPAAMGRFLGMSTITYDPGDMGDWRRVLLESRPPQLDQQAFDQFIIGLKIQELLVPNLPLFWRIPAVDGFDGGVLPLQRYNKFLTLFIPPEQLVPDGRLREQIEEIPSAAMLGLLNVQYVITDKVRDLWFEDVYYDRQIGARLMPSQPTTVLTPTSPLMATHLDLIGYVDDVDDVDDDLAGWRANQPVAMVTVENDAGQQSTYSINAGNQPGADLAGPALDNPAALQAGAVVALRDVERGRQEYRVRLPFSKPLSATAITITQVTGAPPVVIQAATLFDQQTKMFTPLLPSDRGHFALVHSGDVKIYENLDLRPRAYLVHQLFTAANAEEALTHLREEPLIQQGVAAVVEALPAGDGLSTRSTLADPADQVTILRYTAEEVTLAVRSSQDAFLVLSDTNYPGWQATVDDRPTPIYPTNLLFRGIQLPAGEHTVSFRYRPQSWRLGLWISGIALLFWLGLLLFPLTVPFAPMNVRK